MVCSRRGVHREDFAFHAKRRLAPRLDFARLGQRETHVPQAFDGVARRWLFGRVSLRGGRLLGLNFRRGLLHAGFFGRPRGPFLFCALLSGHSVSFPPSNLATVVRPVKERLPLSRRKFCLAIGHVPATENTKPEHFLGRELGLETVVEIPTRRLNAVIRVPALHAIV